MKEPRNAHTAISLIRFSVFDFSDLALFLHNSFSSGRPLFYQIHPDDNFLITKDGAIHKLVIIKCEEEHTGKYRFEADGRKTEAMINVKGLRI